MAGGRSRSKDITGHGEGSAWFAWPLAFDRHVAVKLLHEPLLAEKDDVDRFLGAARVSDEPAGAGSSHA